MTIGNEYVEKDVQSPVRIEGPYDHNPAMHTTDNDELRKYSR